VGPLQALEVDGGKKKALGAVKKRIAGHCGHADHAGRFHGDWKPTPTGKIILIFLEWQDARLCEGPALNFVGVEECAAGQPAESPKKGQSRRALPAGAGKKSDSEADAGHPLAKITGLARRPILKIPHGTSRWV